jgi:hypothetical protein
MMRSLFFIDENPAPKPIATARWLPVAKTYRMWIDFENQNVTVGAGTVHYVSEFWGDAFSERDVGALVLRVANMIDASKAKEVAA